MLDEYNMPFSTHADCNGGVKNDLAWSGLRDLAISDLTHRHQPSCTISKWQPLVIYQPQNASFCVVE